MTSLNNALNNLLQKNDFCCLCFETINEEPIHIADEVFLSSNSCENNVTIKDILPFVFGAKILDLITTYNSFCKQCTNSALNSYTFIQTSKQNIETLTNAVERLLSSFESIPNDVNNNNTLFVALDERETTCKHYYDNKRPKNTISSALHRFNSIISKKVKVETYSPKKKNTMNKSPRKNHRNVNSIPTSDMLFNKNYNLAKCKECLKVYPTIWNLRNHYIRVHAPKIYKCSQCSRRYGSAAFLTAHKNESHCTVVCSECGKTFYNRHTLKMHEHGHQLNLVCSECGRRYKNKETYKKHIEMNVCGRKTRADPAEAKYTCDYCNKRYTQKVSLRVHIQFEHGNYKAHVCEWCGKKFWAQSRLKAHIVKHTKEKKFVCNVCGGVFVTKESLLYHTRIHTGEKPYPCQHCNSKFLSSSRRADHIKRHHTGGSLECEICHCKFNSQTFLLKHRKTHDKCGGKSNYELKTRETVSKIKSKEDSGQIVNFIRVDNNTWVPENVRKGLKATGVPIVSNYEDTDTPHSLEEKVLLGIPVHGDDYAV